jgi:hypothetical protein
MLGREMWVSHVWSYVAQGGGILFRRLIVGRYVVDALVRLL